MGYQHYVPLVFVILTSILRLSHAQNVSQEYVDAHNVARKVVGVKPMKWDARVAKYAENYANQRKLDCAIRHSQSDKYGENIATKAGEFSGSDAVKLWVQEKTDYDYNSNSCAFMKSCEHYTQVVWKKSTRLGCARVKCENNAWFVICNYDPPGNLAQEKPY